MATSTDQSSADYQAMLDRQNQQQQGLFDQYTQAVKGQTPLTTELTNLQNQYGIPGATQQLQGYKDQVTRVQGLLNNLVPDINSRTNGTLTTQAMRDRMASSEGGQLNTQLSALGTAEQPLTDLISSGNQAISTYLPLYEQDQQNALSPLTMQISALGDQFDRQISAYNAAQQLAASNAQAANYSQYLTPSAQPAAASNTSGISQQNQADYNFVKNLIGEVNGGNGNAASLIINQAKNGDARSKQIMQQFYALQGVPIPTSFQSFLS